MPSKARQTFEKHLLKDVDDLIETHKFKNKGQGRPPSSMTRSGIFLLCAAWELYCEEVIKEAYTHIMNKCDHPSKLPEKPRKILAKAVKDHKNDLAPLRMAGDGWREFMNEIVEREVSKLNTPSSGNIIDLFQRLIGVDMTHILEEKAAKLERFIQKRGEIAHKGSSAGHVSINDLEEDYNFICDLVKQLDNALVEPIKELTAQRPWNQR